MPSHPDTVGGLGFIKLHSIAFSLVVLALSSVACAGVAHQMLVHDGRFEQFQIPLITLAVLLAVVFVVPLGAFSSKLRQVSARAKFEYGNLSGRYLIGLHERWVEGRAVPDDPIHSAPEICETKMVWTSGWAANQSGTCRLRSMHCVRRGSGITLVEVEYGQPAIAIEVACQPSCSATTATAARQFIAWLSPSSTTCADADDTGAPNSHRFSRSEPSARVPRPAPRPARKAPARSPDDEPLHL